MVPVSLLNRHSQSSRLLYTLLTVASQHVRRLASHQDAPILAKRTTEFDPDEPKFIVFAVLIPILVLMSGVFAGLTLGYMSLDETQLNVLSISGTPKQRAYANKIKPIRKNGHLLLVTLLLANMIVNESLPVIADPVLGGGFQSVVVSTVLIVIFAEIIPQSLFTRHGLYLGAKMAGFTKVLIYVMGIIAWPVAKLLEFVLGSHHGIIYRRAELKELIAMHSSHATHGGDLKTDTVTIIGATLDLQEKVVKQAMTPISDVFMLSIDSKLDYDLLKKICQTGHSRVPVYEEVDVPVAGEAEADAVGDNEWDMWKGQQQRTQKVKKIVGILLVKQCVLLDPKDATPLRKIPLNKVPFVPNNEPLLGILDKFQEGRSHMAIVSRFSVEKAASVKKAVKRGLTRRLMERVGMGDSDSSDDEKESGLSKDSPAEEKGSGSRHRFRKDSAQDVDGETLTGSGPWEKDYAMGGNGVNDDSTGTGNGNGRRKKLAFRGRGRSKNRGGGRGDVEMGMGTTDGSLNLKGNDEERQNIYKGPGTAGPEEVPTKSRRTSFQLPKAATSISQLEQRMPADAVLAKEGAEEFLQGFDPAVMPLGIITLEDVLEELIGEEIYDEFDPQGAHGDPYEVPSQIHLEASDTVPHAQLQGGTPPASGAKFANPALLRPMTLKGLGFLRSRSAPPIPRDEESETSPAPRTSSDASNQDIPSAMNARTVDIPRARSAIAMPRPIRSPPPVIMGQYGNPSEPTSGPVRGAEKTPKPLPVLADGGDGSGSAPHFTPIPIPMSRSASPAPSLEAILLGRKGKLIGTSNPGYPSATPVPVNSTTSSVGSSVSLMSPQVGIPSAIRPASVKGTRFKSSPLGGGERAGIVVAEKVKEGMSGGANNVDEGGRRRDKEGPGKRIFEIGDEDEN